MNLSSGKQWPIGVSAAIIFIVIACAATIYVALLQPVQEDADLMRDYHSLDASVNELIAAKIAFDKKYRLSYIGEGVSQEGSRLAYHIEDSEGHAVNGAEIKLVLTRPISLNNNIDLAAPRIEEGKYYFDDVKVPFAGRWNILAKVCVEQECRHMNLQSDTLQKNVFEYGLDKPMRNAKANGGRSL
jgi:hypothetical protein